jgi:hypothetical protein
MVSEKIKIPVKQVNQYDKILQECIEDALPGLIKNILNINIEKSEELPDKLQHTKEREPDVLKKVTDENGRIFILQLEFQTTDESNMVYRMADYLIMLSRKYKLPVKQYVIFIGEGIPKMPDRLELETLSFRYNLIGISLIDYRIFLRSKNSDEKIFAILGDFGKDKPKTALTRISESIVQDTQGDLEKERRKNQLRILANLRSFTLEEMEVMEHIKFKVENDVYYRAGQEIGENKGLEQGKIEVIKNLLAANKFSISEIANFASVDEIFVKKVRAKLKQKN